MKTLESYVKLTIIVTREPVPNPKADNGHGYHYVARCDEIPDCYGSGPTVNEALKMFQRLALLWINVVR